MGGRQDRKRQGHREALERALGALESGGGEALPVSVEGLRQAFFFDHGDLVRGLAEVLDRQGLSAAFDALARHLEEDGELWRRRLRALEAEPALRALRAELEADYREVLAAHFRRWGAAGVHGERTADLEAALALAALRGAERLWVQGNGRPVMPVLAQEALGVLWPALYAHARRHG
jgi:hypothetical protein